MMAGILGHNGNGVLRTDSCGLIQDGVPDLSLDLLELLDGLLLAQPVDK